MTTPSWVVVAALAFCVAGDGCPRLSLVVVVVAFRASSGCGGCPSLKKTRFGKQSKHVQNEVNKMGNI